MTRARLALLVVTMVVFSVSVYLGLASLRHRQPPPVLRPHEVMVTMPIAGTIYLTQNGGLYRLQGDRFTELLAAGGGWTQPALAPDHRSLAIVKRSSDWSDLYLLDLDGHPIRQLTSGKGTDVSSDHWAFYPAFSADGTTIYYSLDSPKAGYRVDLSIWSQPVAGGSPRQWTVPNEYTGGDVVPAALTSGGIIYSEFAFNDQSRIHSQLLLQDRQFGAYRALTRPEDDCGQPSLSPDGSRMVMICTGGEQVGRLVVAGFDGSSLASLQVLVDGQLCTDPSWEPDGGGLVYLAPSGAEGKFQLWYLQVPAGASTPLKPVQLTRALDLDAASRIVWF